MILRYCVVLIILIPALSRSQPVKVKLTGRVIASDTHETIPGASLAILGTSRGARSNRLGSYSLELDAEQEYRIRISSLGYKTDTIRIILSKSETRDFTLKVSPLQASEITVSADASRREARRIMHQAIDEKNKWFPSVKNYTCDVYSRISVQKIQSQDTALLSILETYANGYYDKVKGYASRIVARKQTANVPADLNKISLLGVSSFYQDRIEIEPYSIVSPLATDAFDRYDYDLLGTRQIGSSNAWEITVEPRGVLAPAFEGKIWIDQTDYSLVYVQLKPNDAVKFPLVTQATVEQSYVQVKNAYSFPGETHMTIGAELQIPFTPAFSVDITALMQNYDINTTIDDSVFSKTRKIDSLVDKVDSNKWASMRGVALTPQEEKAYSHIDSVVKKETPAKPPSPLSLDYSIIPPITFDRVQSLRLQATLLLSLSETVPFSSSLKGGYAFGDKKFRYKGTLDLPIIWHYKKESSGSATLTSDGDLLFSSRKERVDDLTGYVKIYDDISRRGNDHDEIENTITAALFKRDYPDYFEATGGEIGLGMPLTKNISIYANYINRDERSLAKVTDKALFFKNDTFRVNPAINDGTFRGLTVSAFGNFSSYSVSFDPRMSVMTTSKSFSSSFDFTSLSLSGNLELRLVGVGPTAVNLSYERKLSGAMPNQHLFYFETRNFFLASVGGFHTLRELEYQGDESYSAMIEQNFYDIPTRLLGISLKPLDLHWIGFVNVGGTMLSSESAALLKTPIKTTAGTPFVEAGFGIGNIMNLLRIDAAWRVTHRISCENFAVTATLGLAF